MDELRQILNALKPAEAAGYCRVVSLPDATLEDIVRTFREYRDSVAIFHFGGHARDGSLVLSTAKGRAHEVPTDPLASFLAEQDNLKLVFVNACFTQGQVSRLVERHVAAITTSQAIADHAAKLFARAFYRALASGAELDKAYREASARVRAQFGDHPRQTLNPFDEAHDGDWPWRLECSNRARSELKVWNLPQAARDPYWGLPPPQSRRTPTLPFKNLASFSREDAPIFFGRGAEIRSLYRAILGPDSMVLLYGASGIGKSSLLAAGLVPRLEDRYEVVESRRDESPHDLCEQLHQALQSDSDLHSAWLARERERPLVVILDQAEWLWSQARLAVPGISSEAERLTEALQQIFKSGEPKPRGTLILSFRKEYFAEATQMLDDADLSFHPEFLEHLDHEGIREAITGPASIPRYRLTIEEGLADAIADRLLMDPGAAIAPTLQVLLTKMWQQQRAEGQAETHFSLEMFHALTRGGELLQRFFDEQFDAVRRAAPDDVQTGLALDVLNTHTSPLGTATRQTVESLKSRYGRERQPRILHLVEECKTHYLLSAPRDGTGRQTTRLAHDILAPIVRRRFDESDRPGPRAQRILKNRSEAWNNGQTGVPLDAADLTTVEQGLEGMRSLRDAENRLLEASRESRNRRTRTRRTISAVILFLALGLVGLAVLAVLQSRLHSARVSLVLLDDAHQALQEGRYEQAIRFATLAAQESLLKKADPAAADMLATAAHRGSPVMAFVSHHARHDTIQAFASRDRRLLLTWANDRAMRLWNARTGSLIHSIPHQGRIDHAVFNKTGSRVLTWSGGEAQVWDSGTGELLTSIRPGTGSKPTLDDSGEHALFWSDKTVELWDPTGGSQTSVAEFETPLRGASLSPHGQRVLLWHDQTVEIWTPANGTRTVLAGFEQTVEHARFNATAQRVLAWSQEGSLIVWNTTSGEVVATLQQENLVSDATIDAAGERVLFWGAGGVSLWSIENEGNILSPGEDRTVLDAAFSRDETRIVSWNDRGIVQVWQAATGVITASFNHWKADETFRFDHRIKRPENTHVARGSLDENSDKPPIIQRARFDPRADDVLSWDDQGNAYVWSAETGQQKASAHHGSHISEAFFGESGQTVVSWGQDGTTRIWDRPTTPEPIPIPSTVVAATFDATGTRILSWNPSELAVWNAADGTPLHIATLPASISGAAFDPTGDAFLFWEEDGHATLYRVSSGLQIPLKNSSTIIGARFGPRSERVLTWNADGLAQIWKAENGTQVEASKADLTVVGADFSPDGQRVLAWGAEGTARVWSIGSTNAVLISKEKEPIAGATFDPKGERVLSWSLEARWTRLWDARTGQEIARIDHESGDVLGAAFDPTGQRILSYGEDAALVHKSENGGLAGGALHKSPILGASIHHRERVLSWDSSGLVKVSNALFRFAESRHDTAVRGAMFHPEGGRVLSWSADGEARIWDAGWSVPRHSNRQLIAEVCARKLRPMNPKIKTPYAVGSGGNIIQESALHIAILEVAYSPVIRKYQGQNVCEPPSRLW